MIRNRMPALLTILASSLSMASRSHADATPPEIPLEELAESVLGRVGQASVFQWRRSSLILNVEAGLLQELNVFDSNRVGLVARFPSDVVIWQLGISQVNVIATNASRALGKTPYRQPGRPRRQELSGGAQLVVAEGVGSQLFKILPPFQMVFSLEGQMHYLIYGGAIKSLGWSGALKNSISKKLTPAEIVYLEQHLLEGMALDTARIDTQLGLRLDIFTRGHWNFFSATRLTVPLLAVSQLPFWTETCIGIGYAP